MAFPTGFLWGVSTAAHAIEGAAREGRRSPSAWDKFSLKPGTIADGGVPHPACDHYRRWPQDVGLMQRLGLNAYRFSVDWCRIQPEGRGGFNQQGLDHYGALVDGLLEAGLQPILCLNHDDLPWPLSDRGGWAQRETAYRFCDFAEKTGRTLADRCRWMAPLDQPALVAWRGYLEGRHPPAQATEAAFLAALHHQLLAQGLAMQALRAHDAGLHMGAIHLRAPVRPAEPEEDNDEAADIVKQLLIDSALEMQWHGRYPERLREPMKAVLQEGDRETIQQPIDWIGVSHPGPLYAARAPGRPFGVTLASPPPGRPRTDAGLEIDPEALRDTLMALARTFDMPPLLITAIGPGFNESQPGPPQRDDQNRIAVLRDLLTATGEARAQGADVRGVLLWTLLDGFEGAEGFRHKYGLVAVDRTTQHRTPKTSFTWLQQVIDSQGDWVG